MNPNLINLRNLTNDLHEVQSFLYSARNLMAQSAQRNRHVLDDPEKDYAQLEKAYKMIEDAAELIFYVQTDLHPC